MKKRPFHCGKTLLSTQCIIFLGYGPDYFTAVCSGAILSDYQRIRVEHVCSRLGLVSLAYLWRRDQAELLDQMVDLGLESVLIKTATLGLDQRHLGKTLGQVRGHLHAMNTKFGINVCGEGGEYETLTLNCPLFKKRIVLVETEVEVQEGVGVEEGVPPERHHCLAEVVRVVADHALPLHLHQAR